MARNVLDWRWQEEITRTFRKNAAGWDRVRIP